MPARKAIRAPERGQRIKAARKRAGLTQQQLADAVGVGRVAIGHLETGERQPSLDLANRIAAALGTTLDALYGGGSR